MVTVALFAAILSMLKLMACLGTDAASDMPGADATPARSLFTADQLRGNPLWHATDRF